jgi:hypothetical protein
LAKSRHQVQLGLRGAKKSLDEDQIPALIERAAGGEAKTELAKEPMNFGVSRETVYAYLAGYDPIATRLIELLAALGAAVSYTAVLYTFEGKQTSSSFNDHAEALKFKDVCKFDSNRRMISTPSGPPPNNPTAQSTVGAGPEKSSLTGVQRARSASSIRRAAVQISCRTLGLGIRSRSGTGLARSAPAHPVREDRKPETARRFSR